MTILLLTQTEGWEVIWHLCLVLSLYIQPISRSRVVLVVPLLLCLCLSCYLLFLLTAAGLAQLHMIARVENYGNLQNGFICPPRLAHDLTSAALRPHVRAP